MEGAKRTPLSTRKKEHKRTKTRLVRSIVTYLKSDAYLFAPLLSPQIQMPPPSSTESLKNKTRMSEKVKEYLNSDCYMYRPMISLSKHGSSSSATMREVNKNHRSLSSDIAHLSSPKRTALNSETDLSPAFSSLPEEKMVQPHSRRVPIE